MQSDHGQLQAGEVTIGEKGLGFKSVFAVTDAPRLFSAGFRVEFDSKHPSGLGCVLPRLLPPGPSSPD